MRVQQGGKVPDLKSSFRRRRQGAGLGRCQNACGKAPQSENRRPALSSLQTSALSQRAQLQI